MNIEIDLGDGTPTKAVGVDGALMVLAVELEKGAKIVMVSAAKVLAVYGSDGPRENRQTLTFTGPVPQMVRVVEAALNAFALRHTFKTRLMQQELEAMAELQRLEPPQERLDDLLTRSLPDEIERQCGRNVPALAGPLGVLRAVAPACYKLVLFAPGFNTELVMELTRAMLQMTVHPDGSWRTLGT